MRAGLWNELKAQSFQRTTDLFAGKITRQLHAGWATSTGSFTKCRRMGHCGATMYTQCAFGELILLKAGYECAGRDLLT